MAIRITGTYKNPHGNEFLVDIYDNDFVGSPTEVIILSCKVLWEVEKGDDRHSPIAGSRATIGINIPATDSTLTTFIEDFAYGEDARFLVQITKDNVPTDVWKGILKADQSGEDDIDPFQFRLSAVCGLATLKDKPYHNGTAIYTGVDRFTEHLITALGKMPHVSTFWTGSDVFLQTAVDWWSVSMAAGADDDALFQGGVDHAAFYNYKNEGGVDDDVLSSYDVLSHILKTFGCRIYQSEGAWRIDQISYRTASPYYTRDYDVTGAFLSSTSNSNANVINQTTAGAKLTLVTYDFLPILKKAEVIYDVKTRRNFLNGYNLGNPGNSTIGFDQEISANGGDAIMRLSGSFSFGVKNLSYSGGVNDVLFLVPKIRLKIGDNYLQRDYTISNFTAQVEAPEWTGDSLDRISFPHLLGPVVPVGLSMNGTFNFEILTPGLPDDGSANGIEVTVSTIQKWDGSFANSAQFQIFWSASNLFLEVYDEGTPVVDADQVVYTATNPLDATDIHKTELRIGSEVLSNSAGRIFRWNGTIWVTAPLWGQGVETRDDLIGDILARNILNGQSGPRRRMNGALYGSFRIHRLIQTSDGRKWMFSRVEWDLADDVMNGSWVELNYGVDGVSSTPIKKKVIPNGPTYPPYPGPTDPNGLTNILPGFVVNSPPTVLAPVAYNALDGEISDGATITSIPIKTASAGNEFLAGDGVTLVNPYTGQFQTFEIASAPALGATSLSVTSEVSLYDFPEDSYLVVKQNAYAYSLPNGILGQILRHNGTDWGAYSGVTDGHILTWDTTNGWQAEANPAGGTNYQTLRDDGIDKTQRAAANFLDSARITFTLADDAGNNETEISADILDDAIVFAKMQNIGTDKLLGRDNPGSGDVAEIGLGASLEFDGGANIQRAALTGDVTSLANSNILTIADDVVNNFKLANMAANTIKGNNTGGVADPLDLTVAQAQTLLGFLNSVAGLTNPRIPFANDANTLQDEINLRWLTATKEVIVGDDVSLDARYSHNEVANIAGSSTLMKGDNNVSGDYVVFLKNTRNTGNTGRAIFISEVGGTAAGDPFYVARILSGISWAWGLDNSDGDKFKITNSTAPGGVANSGLIITTGAAAFVGINLDAPIHPLDVSGVARSTQFRNTGNLYAAGNVVFGTGAGTGPVLGSISGGNNWLQITFTTGTTPTANGDIFTITYPNAYGNSSRVAFSPSGNPGGINASTEITKFYISPFVAASFTMKANGTLTASTQYGFSFSVGGY